MQIVLRSCGNLNFPRFNPGYAKHGSDVCTEESVKCHAYTYMYYSRVANVGSCIIIIILGHFIYL